MNSSAGGTKLEKRSFRKIALEGTFSVGFELLLADLLAQILVGEVGQLFGLQLVSQKLKVRGGFGRGSYIRQKASF